jgi:hypothetical protein
LYNLCSELQFTFAEIDTWIDVLEEHMHVGFIGEHM